VVPQEDVVALPALDRVAPCTARTRSSPSRHRSGRRADHVKTVRSRISVMKPAANRISPLSPRRVSLPEPALNSSLPTPPNTMLSPSPASIVSSPP